MLLNKEAVRNVWHSPP